MSYSQDICKCNQCGAPRDFLYCSFLQTFPFDDTTMFRCLKQIQFNYNVKNTQMLCEICFAKLLLNKKFVQDEMQKQGQLPLYNNKELENYCQTKAQIQELGKNYQNVLKIDFIQEFKVVKNHIQTYLQETLQNYKKLMLEQINIELQNSMKSFAQINKSKEELLKQNTNLVREVGSGNDDIDQFFANQILKLRIPEKQQIFDKVSEMVGHIRLPDPQDEMQIIIEILD